MKTITILKKNRKYFACTLENGTKCKLVIDANSESLIPDTYDLELTDKSVRTKYGTDVIFALSAPAEEQADAGICTLTAPYNVDLVNACRGMGGKWDSDEQVWVFSGLVSDEVEELEAKYTEDPVPVEIRAREDMSEGRGPLTFHGYPLAKASGRDSGATLCDGVSKVSGTMGSGGSVKNWTTTCREGATFRLVVPRELALTVQNEWHIRLLDA